MTRKEEIEQQSLLDEDAYVDNNYYAFKRDFELGDEHPNTEDIETVLAYTYKGLGWLAENVEFDIGTTGEHAIACIETLQMICNQTITKLCKGMEK